MKKLMMVLALGLMAQGAWANEHGASAGTGTSLTDRASACSVAKSSADTRAPYGATVTGHSSCDCSSDKTGSLTMWTCTVDAYWEKK